MTDVKRFEDRVQDVLSESERARAQRAGRLAADMESQTAARRHFEARLRQFEAFVEGFYGRMLGPRLAVLASRFPNLSADRYRTSAGCYWIWTFGKTERFPASTTLTLGLDLDATGERVAAVYRLEIVPAFMPYDSSDRLDVSIDDLTGPAIDQWVEAHLLRFLDTYMRLETEPKYQQENLETDPVCGMEVSRVDVIYRCEVGETSYYFCSETCFTRFVADPAWFLAGPARSAGG